ncbi:MAG: hypothetical protein KDA93_20355 [Planctomycetaceae bacterium]|nr:hypothetical protein [Planctomycetaceae bacterium]
MKYGQDSSWFRVVAWIVIQCCCIVQIADAEISPDFLMDSDPELQVPEPIQKYDPQLTVLWLQALARPEIDMQRMAAETIARAQGRGVPDLEKAIPRLEEILTSSTSHPAARFAAARALIVLESRDSISQLFDVSQAYGSDFRQLIEPALATWGMPSVREVWIGRLTSADTRFRDLALAIRGLGEVRETSALPELLNIVNDVTRNSAIRLEAAKAAGSIAESGLEPEVERLLADSQTPLSVNQLCAIRLLGSHSSGEAKQFLVQLARHDEPTVVAAALQRLNAIDYSLVLPVAGLAIQNSDVQVRRQGVHCMLERPELSHIEPLSGLLADPHPGLRHEVCEGLFQLAERSEFSEPIREAAMEVLAGDPWQGQQEASLLLGALEHQPAAERLVELLESPRVEVSVHSAWALRKVAVPETVPAMIEQANRQAERRRLVGDRPEIDMQLAHLFEAVGVIKAKDALPLLTEYIPKTDGNHYARGAAIWAIGQIKSGERDSRIEDKLAERILDDEPRPSETMLVKQMSAIALGRMQAVDQADMMRGRSLKISAASESDDIDVSEKNEARLRLALALGWAVKALTGEELPPPNPLIAGESRWFLEPVN